MSTPTVGDLLSAIATVAPFDAAAGWDPVGLQLGDPAAPAGAVAVCHEVTGRVVDAALDAGIDTLVTYHPLLFHSTRRLVVGADASGRAHRLVRAGISLVVVHTAFDVAQGGTADALADLLGLQAITGFGPLWGSDSLRLVVYADPDETATLREALVAAGAGSDRGVTGCRFRSTVGDPTDAAGERLELVVDRGRLDAVVAALGVAKGDGRPRYDVIEARGDAGYVGRVGTLPAPISIMDFAVDAGTRLAVTPRVAAGDVTTAYRIAVLPGSGASMLSAAAATGADVFVTGDVAHHEARLANECGLAIVDAAHAPTERPGVARLYAAVAALADGALDLTATDEDPWETN